MGQLKELQNRHKILGDHICKGFADDNNFDELCKARAVGDAHPNGKWVWTEYEPGKFDWRAVKRKTSASQPQTPPKAKVTPKQETEEKETTISKLNEALEYYDDMEGTGAMYRRREFKKLKSYWNDLRMLKTFQRENNAYCEPVRNLALERYEELKNTKK